MKSRTPHNKLKRELAIGSATMMGLGSIIGTGIFVSIGVATGPSVILAIALKLIELDLQIFC